MVEVGEERGLRVCVGRGRREVGIVTHMVVEFADFIIYVVGGVVAVV